MQTPPNLADTYTLETELALLHNKDKNNNNNNNTNNNNADTA